MAAGLFMDDGKTTVSRILVAKRFFDVNPTRTIPTGCWKEPRMSKEDFYAWFRRCLFLKTGGAEMTHRDHLLRRDCFIIQDYLIHNVRSTGSRNLLSTPKMKRMYPQVDNQIITD